MTVQTARNWIIANALWLGVLWGFAEGSVFFIVPDILISFVALFSIKRALQCLAAVLIGSLIAGTLLYFYAVSQPEAALGLIHAVPFIPEQMFEKVGIDYQNYGAIALLIGPTSGIPYKVYAVLAPHFIDFLNFILISIPARLERLVITWAIFSAIGFGLRKKRWDKPKMMIVLHALYWCMIYTYYWSVL